MKTQAPAEEPPSAVAPAVEPPAASSSVAPPPDDRLPASLRREHLIEYDLERFPFPTIVRDLLAHDELTALHKTVTAQQWLQGIMTNNSRAYAVRRNAFDKRFKEVDPFRRGCPLNDCYLRFLREVIAPTIEAHVPGGSVEMLYQAQPNFRCHLPDTGHLLVHLHRDADYHHQPNELNVWLPLTPCAGTNTLWSESMPDKGDYRPFELVPGQCMLFWGHQCKHYTVPNDSGITRVSIDFRVVPPGYYKASYPNSHRRDGQARFARGCFFATLTDHDDERAAAEPPPADAPGESEDDELEPGLMEAIAVF